MQGTKMQSAIIAVSKFLQTLSRQDRFAILGIHIPSLPMDKPVGSKSGSTSGVKWLQAVTAAEVPS